MPSTWFQRVPAPGPGQLALEADLRSETDFFNLFFSMGTRGPGAISTFNKSNLFYRRGTIGGWEGITPRLYRRLRMTQEQTILQLVK